MREEEVRRYAELMEKWDIRSLTVTDRDSTISMERGSREAAPGIQWRNSAFASPASAQNAPAGADTYTGYGSTLPSGLLQPEGSAAAEQDRKTENDTRVSSPLVGVFYAAPAENADPFVSVGDTVKKGDTLCIIEAMKLMNEVRAEQDGVVSKICVTNGQVVEYGTELFRIGKM